MFILARVHILFPGIESREIDPPFLNRPVKTPPHLDLLDDAEAADDLAEDDVLVVQPVRLLRRDEELRTVRARTRVGHREDPGLGGD